MLSKYNYLIFAFLYGCGGSEPTSDSAERLWEGMTTGECSDEADNDGDGAYDCADSDCAGSPDCTEETGQTLDDDAKLQAAWEALIERVEDEVEQEGVPGISLAVLVDGKLAFSGGVGVHTYASGSPVNSDTVYRWNSVSKMHTATAILRAVEAGEAALEDPVTEWVPELNLGGGYDPSDITLHHLLTHTAALPDMWTTSCSDTSDGGLADYYLGRRITLMGPPGAFYNYSNNNWNLLGLVAERIYGAPFLELIDSEVLDPTGMTSGTFDVEQAVDGPYAIGVDSNYEYYTPDLHDCAYMRPCTMLHGSVLDLAETARLHLADGDELLSSDTVAAMRSQHTTGYPDGSTVGYGQFTYSYRGVPYIAHSGSGAGFRSQWSIVPEQGFGVVVVANAAWADPYQIVEEAFDLFLDFDPDWQPTSTQTDPDTWGDYEGSYEDPTYWGTLEVYQRDNDKLYMDMLDSGGSYRLYQYGGDTFFFVRNGYWYTVRFMRDDAGDVGWMVNRYWVGARQAQMGAVGAPPSTAEDREMVWQQSARRYRPDSHRPLMDD